MPVITKSESVADPNSFLELRQALAAELRSPKSYGQPTISEESLPRTVHFAVVVFWDRWEVVPDEERPGLIHAAYEDVQPERADRIAYAIGYSIPEAAHVGLLRYNVGLDAVKAPKERRADLYKLMYEVGASRALRGDVPAFFCLTEEEAVGNINELVSRAPGTEDYWTLFEPL